jgi:predicted CoA-binding protein
MKTSRAAVDEFLAKPAMAIVGASRSGRKFGNIAMRELRVRGYRVYPIHPVAEMIDKVPCYPSFEKLPEKVDALLVVVPPIAAFEVIRDAAAAGVRHVWLQQGAESADLVKLCRDLGMTVVARECILMFAQPTGFHKLHRWIWGALGRLPAAP